MITRIKGKEYETCPILVMGMTEVSNRLDWKPQQVTNYLNRARAKGFPAGMLPEPFQRIKSGWLWFASDIEEYAKEKGL